MTGIGCHPFELMNDRARAGRLTRVELSFEAGLSCPYISQLDGNLKPAIIAMLFRICDAPEVSIGPPPHQSRANSVNLRSCPTNRP